jgi:ferric-dicitrate binding protein FerR (iron transport regulator)
MFPSRFVRPIHRSQHLAGSVVLCALAIGCASGGGTPATGASAAAKPASRSQNVITREELASQAAGLNAYDAIQRLRPRMLRPETRSTMSGTSPGSTVAGNAMGAGPTLLTPEVYMNERPYSTEIGALRDLLVSNISEIRFLTPSEAQMRWGSGHLGGVIQIVTADRPN